MCVCVSVCVGLGWQFGGLGLRRVCVGLGFTMFVLQCVKVGNLARDAGLGLEKCVCGFGFEHLCFRV